ncbi:MAG: VWA domain-containing protein [Oscillospiraceae bacterium]
MDSYIRRLPIYLLIDCSGSMNGEPIESVKQGIKALIADLKGDPQAVETAYLSIITFDSSARQVSPLTELMLFKEPEIRATGATAMGGALTVLAESIKNEVRVTTDTQKGDWKPLVFLLTDGSPTDNLDDGINALSQVKTGNIIACAAGASANTANLKKITPNVLMMNSLTAGDMAQYFKWVSSSIKVSSNSIDAKPGAPVELPPPPQGFVIVP